MHYSGFAVFVTLFVGILISVITGFNDPNNLDPKLYIDIKKLCCSFFKRSSYKLKSNKIDDKVIIIINILNILLSNQSINIKNLLIEKK